MGFEREEGVLVRRTGRRKNTVAIEMDSSVYTRERKAPKPEMDGDHPEAREKAHPHLPGYDFLFLCR